MKKIWFWNQNQVDPSPEALAFMSKLARGAFTAAEYCLIAGVFVFLAVETKHWAVIVLAIFLSSILALWVLSLIGGFRFFDWRAAEKWYSKSFFFILDSALYIAAFWTVVLAFGAIYEAFKKGIGV